jgi:hypothetical protein
VQYSYEQLAGILVTALSSSFEAKTACTALDASTTVRLSSPFETETACTALDASTTVRLSPPFESKTTYPAPSSLTTAQLVDKQRYKPIQDQNSL